MFTSESQEVCKVLKEIPAGIHNRVLAVIQVHNTGFFRYDPEFLETLSTIIFVTVKSMLYKIKESNPFFYFIFTFT